MEDNKDHLGSSGGTAESLSEAVTSREFVLGITNVEPPEPAWHKRPPVTGAYWWGIRGSSGRPEICWVHQGAIWFAPVMASDHRDVDYYAEHGEFYGPLQAPQTA